MFKADMDALLKEYERIDMPQLRAQLRGNGEANRRPTKATMIRVAQALELIDQNMGAARAYFDQDTRIRELEADVAERDSQIDRLVRTVQGLELANASYKAMERAYQQALRIVCQTIAGAASPDSTG